MNNVKNGVTRRLKFALLAGSVFVVSGAQAADLHVVPAVMPFAQATADAPPPLPDDDMLALPPLPGEAVQESTLEETGDLPSLPPLPSADTGAEEPTPLLVTPLADEPPAPLPDIRDATADIAMPSAPEELPALDDLPAPEMAAPPPPAPDLMPPPLPGEAPAVESEESVAAQSAEAAFGDPILPEDDSGEVFDIFSDPNPEEVVAEPEPEPVKPAPVKKVVKAPEPQEPLVKLPKEYRLPSKIYRKSYSIDNYHLPTARYEHEYDEQLFKAVGNDRPEIVRSLLETGRAIEMHNAEGDTPLLYAVRTRALNTLRMLLGRGANPNAANNRGISALHYAILANDQLMVDALLDMGADPDLPDMSGVTPLMLAVSRDNAAFTAELVQHGAMINLPSVDGRTPLHIAAETNNAAALALLVQGGGDVNMRSRSGYTPLMSAAIVGAYDAAVVLLNAGADASATDAQGRSAIDLARGRGNSKIANAIMSQTVQQQRMAQQGRLSRLPTIRNTTGM